MKNLKIIVLYFLLVIFLSSCQEKEDTISFKESLKTEQVKTVLDRSISKNQSALIRQALYANPEEYGFKKLTIQKDNYPNITEFDIYTRQLKKGDDEEFVMKRKGIGLKSGSGRTVEVRSDQCNCSGSASDIASDYFDDLCKYTGRGAFNMEYTVEGHGSGASGSGGSGRDFWMSMSSGSFVGAWPEPERAESAIESVPDQWIQ